MGLSVSDVYAAIRMMLAPVYANDFFYQGRVQRVMVQADAPYRMDADALNRIYVPAKRTSSTNSEADSPRPHELQHDFARKRARRLGIGPPSTARHNDFRPSRSPGSPRPA
jgi:multidrug efflux pump